MSEQIFGDVGVTRHGHVAGVEMRRPPHNFFDVPLVSHLADAVEALDADPELADAFRALTPGRQNSYVINLAQAKQPATRTASIEKFRPRILAGKGAQER